MPKTPDMADIKDRLADILVRTSEAAARGVREGDGCRVIAMSKTHPAGRIREALAAGHRIFGENRIQEAAEKWLDLRQDFPDIELHLIGGLQTNKVKDAVALFDVIQTVDREKLARALKKEMDKSGKTVRLFIQVNTGEEPQKGGIPSSELPALLRCCRDELDLAIEGLMCIPPLDEEPALHFALLKKLAGRFGLEKLSMGMSGDFELAAEMGAHYVRVGTAIFGARISR